jgi:hypothetical protein
MLSAYATQARFVMRPTTHRGFVLGAGSGTREAPVPLVAEALSGGAASDATPPHPERTPPHGFGAGVVLVGADTESVVRCH